MPQILQSVLLSLCTLSLNTADAHLTPSQTSLDFGSVQVGQTVQQGLSILWDGEEPLDVTFDDPASLFLVSPASATIQPNTWTNLTVQFTASQNKDYAASLVIQGSKDALTLPLSAAGDLPGSTWDSTFNLDGEALKSHLTTLVSGHSVYSYDSAREHMFGEYDNVSGWVEGVYTGYMVQTWGIPNSNLMNCEHTWPQSYGADGDARSDMQHLYPCKSTVNSSRGNLPFGTVVNSSSGYPLNGADRGTNAQGITVFEPRPTHRGDCARSLFYFLIRYGNRESFMNQASQEGVLRDWCATDLPDSWEENRQDAIAALQNRRNPFVDHPAFLDRMASLTGNANLTYSAEVEVYPSALALGEQETENPSGGHVVICNPGTSSLTIQSLSIHPLCFSVDTNPTVVPAGGSVSLLLTPVESCGMDPSAILEIQTSEGNFSIPLSAQFLQAGVEVPDLSVSNYGEQIILNWQPTVGATWYRLEFAQSQDGPWIPLSTDSSTLRVVDSSLFPSPSLFRVIAGN
jgi:deoxyribonuclease I